VEQVTVKASKRERSGKSVARGLRRQGYIPAEVYGKGENISIAIEQGELKPLKKHHFSENMIVNLDVDSGVGSVAAIIKSYQLHPLTDQVIHLDFLKIALGEKIRVEIPIELRGEARGMKEGGLVDQHLFHLTIECLPMDMPESVEVDVSALGVTQSLHVSDLRLPETLHVMNDPKDSIVSVVVAREEDEAAADAASTDVAQPEVLREKKEEPKK
jgi:large subunit ribosomal protein L25